MESFSLSLQRHSWKIPAPSARFKNGQGTRQNLAERKNYMCALGKVMYWCKYTLLNYCTKMSSLYSWFSAYAISHEVSYRPLISAEYDYRYKNLSKMKCRYGWAWKNLHNQGRDENTRRLSYCRKVVIKKDWMTTLLLLQKLSQATEVEQSSIHTLPLSWVFCSRIGFLCFHFFLVFVLFSGPSLLGLHCCKKFSPLFYVLFWLLLYL